jgi:hypothetical protein
MSNDPNSFCIRCERPSGDCVCDAELRVWPCTFCYAPSTPDPYPAEDDHFCERCTAKINAEYDECLEWERSMEVDHE